MNNKIIFFSSIILICVAGYIFFKKNGIEKDNNDFIVGTASGYAPFVSINQDGDYEGFDIDVAQELARKMGKNLVIQDLGSMAGLFMALENGAIDAIIWGLSITQDRLKKIAMIRYQGENTQAFQLIFWRPIPDGIKKIDDMYGLTVCVEPASSQDAVLSRYPSIIKLPTERVDDALLNIQYGKADAALVEPAIAKKFKKIYPNIQIIDVPLLPEDQVFGIGIAIKLTNSKLISQVEQAIAKLQTSEAILQLEKKWGL